MTIQTSVPAAAQVLTRGFLAQFPDESAKTLNGLPVEEIVRLLMAGPVTHSVGVFVRLDPDIAANAVPLMSKGLFVDIFSTMDPVRAASLLARMDPGAVKERLALLPPAASTELIDLMSYPAESAGSMMDPRVTVFREDETVQDALDRIRGQGERRTIDLCIVNQEGVLTGVVPLREVAVSLPDQRLGDVEGRTRVSIEAMAPRDEVVELLDQKLMSLPVVDFEGRLLGVIRHNTLVTAAQEDVSGALQTMVGAGRSERALSTAGYAVKMRLPWLQINLGTAFLAAAVVGLFEDTIARFTSLAILLPVVAGQSGNTGAQALAVTMRGLTLREFRPREWLRVVRKELIAGFINGCGIGLTTALFVYLFMGPGLAFVIGVSMVLSMISASLAGACIPVLLTALRQDPAQSASIILTTVTDVMGFLSFLGFATIVANVFEIAL